MNIRKQVKKFQKAYEDSFEDIRKKYNLTMKEIMVLNYLNNNKDKNTSKDLVDEVMATKSHISLSVDNLAQKGIIEKIQDKEDKKIVHLILTDRFHDLLDEINKRNRYLTEKTTENISKKDIEITEKTLKKIQDNIENLIAEINNTKN